MKNLQASLGGHSPCLGVSVAERVFELPGGHGLTCQHCGAPLTRVNHTRTTQGFIFRERHCEACNKINTTSERIVAVRDRKRKFSDPCGE